MKHWFWYLAALLLAAAVFGMPFQDVDVAKLQPVQVIGVAQRLSGVVVTTDTGDVGLGESLERALQNLEQTTPGYVFLETAQYLIINDEGLPLLPALANVLRPGCAVYLLEGEADIGELAAFLAAHPSQVTLRDCAAGNQVLPLLIANGGRFSLAGA